MAGFMLAHGTIIGRLLRRGFAKGHMPRISPKIIGPLFVLVLAVQLLNATAMVFDRSYAAYFLGLVLFLGIALTDFAFLVTKLWDPTV